MSQRSSSYPTLSGSLCSDPAASVTFQPANLLTCQRSSPNSFICHTSAKSPTKSFPCHTSKNPLPQVLCLPHIQAPRGALRPRRHPEPKARDLLCLSFCLSFAFPYSLTSFS